jgi:hypothetical protein
MEKLLRKKNLELQRHISPKNNMWPIDQMNPAKEKFIGDASLT